MRNIFLVNPWIHDFAAFDLWTVPLGLLYLAGFFRENNMRVFFFDLTDPFYRSNYGLDGGEPRRKLGKGHYPKQVIEKPPQLSFFPRRFRRYGIPPEDLEKIVKNYPHPDLIFMTSRMTYWYTGVRETISFFRKLYPDVKIILGGIYATLLPEHAKNYTGADFVISGPFERNIKLLEEIVSQEITQKFPPVPYFDVYKKKDFVPVLLSRGCPFKCSYCASPFLYPIYEEYDIKMIVEYLLYQTERLDTSHIVIYDDAFLYRKQEKAVFFLKTLIKSGKNFHLHFPNALHARFVDEEIAYLLKEAGGKSLFLGLEFSSPELQKKTGGKVNRQSFESAVRNLRNAGFEQREIGVYIMAGYPYQEKEEVKRSIDYVLEVGGYPKLVEFSPIPGTPDWEKAVEVSPFPLEEEPLFHNNTIFPCRWDKFSFEDLIFLKSYLREKVTKINS